MRAEQLTTPVAVAHRLYVCIPLETPPGLVAAYHSDFRDLLTQLKLIADTFMAQIMKVQICYTHHFARPCKGR